MRILVDACLSDVLESASLCDTPTYLCYVLYDNFTYIHVKPLLFHSIDFVKASIDDGIEDFYYVGEVRPRVNPNEVKQLLAEHYYYQLFGDTFQEKPLKRNLFDLKLND